MRCDEVAPYNKSHAKNDLFKDIITGKTTRLEQKGIDPFTSSTSATSPAP